MYNNLTEYGLSFPLEKKEIGVLKRQVKVAISKSQNVSVGFCLTHLSDSRGELILLHHTISNLQTNPCKYVLENTSCCA